MQSVTYFASGATVFYMGLPPQTPRLVCFPLLSVGFLHAFRVQKSLF
jgi:hypothetical protein